MAEMLDDVLKATDPRKAKTLGEAAQNPDGTWNGARALSWLSEVVTGGHGVPVEEVMTMWQEAKRRAEAKR